MLFRSSFDYPERKYKIIHIAGTNGKGSVSAFLAFILREAGYKVGRYISPILRDYCEKIQFLEKENEYYITKEEVALYMSEIKQNVGTLSPSPFELETLMAMLSFRDHKCDYVILECGMGGIEDATNAISRKEMCIFTSISYDHMSYLGNTLEKIADNKLGILQNNVPIVCGWQEESIRKRIQSVAKQMNAPITICSNPIITSSSISYTQFSYKDRDWTIPLIGEYQPNNAVVAIEAAYILLASIEELARISIIQRGLGKAIWPGRFQILSDCPRSEERRVGKEC